MPRPPQLEGGTKWCLYHCAVCDQCFRSVAGFDQHRRGSHRRNTRHCVDPATRLKEDGSKMLAFYRGKCKLGKDMPIAAAKVWYIKGVDDL